MGWFRRSKLHRAVTDLRREVAELGDSARRQEQRLIALADRLESIEEAAESDRDALEKARLSLVRMDLQLRMSAEESEKTVAALLDRIETYRVNMKAA